MAFSSYTVCKAVEKLNEDYQIYNVETLSVRFSTQDGYLMLHYWVCQNGNDELNFAEAEILVAISCHVGPEKLSYKLLLKFISYFLVDKNDFKNLTIN